MATAAHPGKPLIVATLGTSTKFGSKNDFGSTDGAKVAIDECRRSPLQPEYEEPTSMRKCRLTCLASLFAVFAASDDAIARCDPGETVIKFSHVAAAKRHPKGEAITLLAARINAEMNGTACMVVYPNSQLYNDNKVLEALLLGDIQLAAPSLSKFEKYTTKLRIFDLPFVFDDIDAVDRFQLGPAGQKLLQAMTDKGILGLGYLHNGMKHFSANRPLVSPADAKNLKFRVQPSQVNVSMIEALGANAQTLAFSEVYGALQTGVVDGQENTWSNIYTKKFFEVQDGITETNHIVLDYLVVASRDWWNGLAPTTRDNLHEIILRTLADRNALSTQINEKNRKNIENAGTTIRHLTKQQRQAWVDAMQPVWKKYAPDIGQDVIDAARDANIKSTTAQ